MRSIDDEKMAIGKLVYDGELTVHQASVEYDVTEKTVNYWVKKYKESIGLKGTSKKYNNNNNVLSNERAAYENMTKEELIRELILAKANELRAKKGYEVRGVGANKEFITSDEENSK